jgi:hypothetical protein
MARQVKTRPARRESATNDSLLIRSAESLGRMIGSLQRQLDAARHVTDRADSDQFSGNGHVPARQSGRTAKTQRTKSGGMSKAGGTQSAADRKSKRAAKSAAKKTGVRNRSGAKQRAAKASRSR